MWIRLDYHPLLPHLLLLLLHDLVHPQFLLLLLYRLFSSSSTNMSLPVPASFSEGVQGTPPQFAVSSSSGSGSSSVGAIIHSPLPSGSGIVPSAHGGSGIGLGSSGSGTHAPVSSSSALQYPAGHFTSRTQSNKYLNINCSSTKKEIQRVIGCADDIYDKGKTATTVENLMRPAECEFVFLVIRNGSQKANYHVTAGRDLKNDKRWVRFPWETGTEKRRKDIASAITI